MSEVSLQEHVVSYEMLFKYREEICRDRGALASKMFEFYAMLTAFQLFARTGISGKRAIDEVGELQSTEGRLTAEQELTELEVIHGAGQTLLASAASGDRVGMATALEEMGVIELCPTLDLQFSRMEAFLRLFEGRAYLVLLVEMANLAIEFGEYERADKYVQEARVADPGSWERYNLATVEGLIALSVGKIREAVQCLAESMNACLKDEYSSLGCGIRSPNFALAQMLLARGERVEVVRHLLQCKDVWQFFQKQLDEWISLIESGATPDFQASAVLRSINQPSSRLISQWVLAEYPEEARSSTPKSAEAVKAARERLKADFGSALDSSVEKRLKLNDIRPKKQD